MAIIPGTIKSQEKLVAALSYLFFPIPHLMDIKTEFTMHHSKQSFLLFCINVIGFIISFLPFIGFSVQFIISMCTFFIGCWCAYQAYMGIKFAIPVMSQYTNTVISKLNIAKFFQV